MAVEALTPLTPLSSAYQPGSSASVGGGFEQLVSNYLGQATQTDQAATQAIQDLALGKADDLHSVALAVSQADLSFRLVLQIRNRLIEAYQEIQRIQI